MKKLFLCTLLLFLVSCASSQKNEARIVVIKRQLDAIFSNQENTWNDFDLRKFPVAFVLSNEKSAYLYDAGRMENLGMESLPKYIQTFPIPFAVETVNGRKTLIMLLDNLESRPNESGSIHFTVHEAFHAFYQEKNPKWKEQAVHQKKGLILPIDPKARYYRWEMSRLISQYLENGDVKNLSSFSAVFNKWRDAYDIEASSDADRTEGSAEYVAIAAGSFVENQNSSSEGRYAYLKKVRKDWFEKSNLDFDDEAYLLGTLAGLALNKLNVINWEDQVNSGSSPLSILAKINAPITFEDDPKESALFERLSIDKMKKIDPDGTLKKYLNDLANHKLSFIAVNNKKVSPYTFTMRNAFRTPDPFNINSYVNVYDISSAVSIVSSNRSSNIMEIKKPLISLSFESTPCDRNVKNRRDSFIVWAIDSSLVKSGKIKADYIELHAKYRIITKNNTSWICID